MKQILQLNDYFWLLSLFRELLFIFKTKFKYLHNLKTFYTDNIFTNNFYNNLF